MSPLPQRKKSADEIAKLREAMGIPTENLVLEDFVNIEPVLKETAIPAKIEEKPIPAEQRIERPATLPFTTPLPPAEVPFPMAHAGTARPVRSLKRSERTSLPHEEEHEAVEPAPIVLPENGRVVKSLRKSEQVPIIPVENHTPPANSKLPVHRHSDRDLDRIRRQGAIQQMQAVGVDPQLQIAHLALVIPAYLFALAGPIGIYFYDISIAFTAGAVLIAAAVAVFIFFKKPMSRHHAAFLAVSVLFVIIFGLLHYFPQLQHGT